MKNKRKLSHPGAFMAYTETNPCQSIHWHEDYEIVYVLKGSIQLHINCFDIILNEKEAMIISTADSHRLNSITEDTQVLYLQLDYDNTSKLAPNIFESLAIVHYLKGYEGINSNPSLLFTDISYLADIVSSKEPLDNHEIHLLNKRIKTLITHIVYLYTSKATNTHTLNSSSPEKMTVIFRFIHFIYKHLGEKITLENFAKQEHLSYFYLSRTIKDVTGISFRDWLNYVRSEYAEKLLLSTNNSIVKISEECGFSNVRYFTKAFLLWYNISPVNFRKEFKTAHTMQLNEKINRKLSPLIFASENNELKSDTIILDIEMLKKCNSSPISIPKDFYCPLTYLSLEDLSNHFILVNKQLGIIEISIMIDDLSLLTHESSPTLQKNMSTLKSLKYTIRFQVYRNLISSKYKDNLENLFLNHIHPLEINKIEVLDEKNAHMEIPTLFLSQSLDYRISIYNLVTKEGERTVLYFYLFFLKKMNQGTLVHNDNYIVTGKEDFLQLFLHNNFFENGDGDDHSFKIKFNKTTKDFRYIHTSWDSINGSISCDNASTFSNLSSSELNTFIYTSNPNVNFGTIKTNTSFSKNILVSSSEIHIFEVYPIKKYMTIESTSKIE